MPPYAANHSGSITNRTRRGGGLPKVRRCKQNSDYFNLHLVAQVEQPWWRGGGQGKDLHALSTGTCISLSLSSLYHFSNSSIEGRCEKIKSLGVRLSPTHYRRFPLNAKNINLPSFSPGHGGGAW